MPDDENTEGLPRRGGEALPAEFGPLTPLGRPIEPDPTTQAATPRPRSRLTASASRRNSPDRAVAPPTPATAAPPPMFDAPAPSIESTPDATPATGAPKRTALVASVALVLLGLVGATFLLWPDSAPDTDAASAATGTGADVSPLGDFEPPAAVSPDSEYVETEVLEGGHLQVTHWISTTKPIEQVRLRGPSSPALPDLLLDVQEVVVAADGVPVDKTALDSVSDEAAALPGSRELFVQYVLSDALQASGSVEGRALATVTSLDIGLGGQQLARTQVFPGGKVLTLACLAQGARAVPESCGAYEEGAWRLESEADDVPITVIAQFDLSVTR